MRNSATPASAPRTRGELAPHEQTRAFLRKVGHELRTPLNSILGFSEILAAELYGPLGAPQYREYAEIINDSGKKLLRLVDQVVEIARLESGTIEWEMGPEALEPALHEVLAGLAEEIARRDVRVEVAEPEAMPEVVADARGLRNVLKGLIHNAVAVSPEAATVRIRAARRGAAVDLVVEDEGGEVGREELPRLLQPFGGKGAASGRGDGAGLGLPICALTCRAMGGRLSLASVKGRGLRARVQLRAA
ncbi:MAG TPA: HAMP domain-containing sensor histidine kinase [Phenylobacterium sp.]|uniref:sensor histidine kinase n=1 Tax=Phenylobacterium sp. TaxID=1871053 RepID=UPI002CA3C147|nr:HAMP domain-containing sensor histidine kinase [Phenylobacterium sp.]HSV04053.1 HAMP domain-containing sensor histidine kinase [Phenylobacterium sp.]